MSANIQTPLPVDANRFAQGLTFDDYVAAMTQNQRRIQQMYQHYQLTTDDIATLNDVVGKHGGHLYVTALVEDWCPDVSLNVPVVQHMAEAVKGIELQLFVRPNHPDLRATYEADGIFSLPVFSFFNSDWEEIARWVERSQVAQQRRQGWLDANHPNLEALRASDDPADKDRLHKIFASLFSQMLTWYQEDDLWRESVKEILDVLGRAEPATI